jgi:hypothetical protein
MAFPAAKTETRIEMTALAGETQSGEPLAGKPVARKIKSAREIVPRGER